MFKKIKYCSVFLNMIQTHLPDKLQKTLLILAAIFFVTNCSNRTTDDESYVARIGDRGISVDEFQKSYETAIGALKIGKDVQERKRNYLEFMINEQLLVLEGYQIGLQNKRRVQTRQAFLMNELLIDELIERDVRSKISVTMDEIKQEINKSKVSFKFRFWPVSDPKDAMRISLQMKERGYAAVVDDLRKNNPEIKNIDPKQFESDYVDYQSVTPEVLEAIKDLPYGEISDPVKLGNQYIIFQVLDIRRQGVTENDYNALAPRFEQIVFYYKYQRAIKRYASEMLKSLNIRTKAKAFNLLAAAFSEWHKSPVLKQKRFQYAVEHAKAVTPKLFALRKYLNQPFFVYKNGNVSAGEFLKYFDPSRVNNVLSGTEDYKETLNFATATTIRDYFMIQRAKKRGLENAKPVQAELKIWRDKWVFEEAKQYFTDPIDIDSSDVIRFIQDHINQFEADADFQSENVKGAAKLYKKINALKQRAKNLRKKYKVSINIAVLDTIEVVDSKKSRWMSMKIFRGGTNRQAFPTVDPIWVIDRKTP